MIHFIYLFVFAADVQELKACYEKQKRKSKKEDDIGKRVLNIIVVHGGFEPS